MNGSSPRTERADRPRCAFDVTLNCALSVENNPGISDTSTGLVPPDGDAGSLWTREPAVVAGFIAAVVTACEQAKRMTAEEAAALPTWVAKALGMLDGAVRHLMTAAEAASYPSRLAFWPVAEDGPPPEADELPSSPSPQPHTCVSIGTERARRLGILVATRAEVGTVAATANQIADDVLFMRRRNLCLSCGFPLDNSPPHPLARQPGAPGQNEESK